MTDAPDQPPPMEPRYVPFLADAPPPQYHWATPFATGDRQALVTIGFLAILVVAEIVSAGINYHNYQAFVARGGLGPGLAGDWKDWLTDAIAVVSLVAFAVWTHRVYRNLPALGARDLRFTPAWAVAWLFIPLANLVVPLLVFMEIWRGSLPTPAGAAAGKKRRTSLLVVGWWIANVLPFFVLAAAAGYFFYFYLQLYLANGPTSDAAAPAFTLQDLETDLWQVNAIVLPLLAGVAAMLAIFVVRATNRNQQKKFDMLRAS